MIAAAASKDDNIRRDPVVKELDFNKVPEGTPKEHFSTSTKNLSSQPPPAITASVPDKVQASVHININAPAPTSIVSDHKVETSKAEEHGTQLSALSAENKVLKGQLQQAEYDLETLEEQVDLHASHIEKLMKLVTSGSRIVIQKTRKRPLVALAGFGLSLLLLNRCKRKRGGRIKRVPHVTLRSLDKQESIHHCPRKRTNKPTVPYIIRPGDTISSIARARMAEGTF